MQVKYLNGHCLCLGRVATETLFSLQVLLKLYNQLELFHLCGNGLTF